MTLSTSRVNQLEHSGLFTRLLQLRTVVGSHITPIAYQNLLDRWDPICLQAKTLDELSQRYNTPSCSTQLQQTITVLLCLAGFNVKLRKLEADVAQYFN